MCACCEAVQHNCKLKSSWYASYAPAVCSPKKALTPSSPSEIRAIMAALQSGQWVCLVPSITFCVSEVVVFMRVTSLTRVPARNRRRVLVFPYMVYDAYFLCCFGVLICLGMVVYILWLGQVVLWRRN